MAIFSAFNVVSVSAVQWAGGALMSDPEPEKSKRVTDAMLKMQKIIIADLQKAYDGR